MLIFNPNKRISIEGSLQHPFFKDLYCPEDEPVRSPLNPMEFEFENLDLNKEQLKDLIFEEISEHCRFFWYVTLAKKILFFDSSFSAMPSQTL